MNSITRTVNIGKAERVVSILGGGWLLWNSLMNRRARGIKSIAAAYMLYRGITGNCAAYTMAGRQSWREYRNVNIRDSLYIKRSPISLYHMWRNLENLPRFMTHLVSVEKIYDNIYEFKARIPGNPLPLQWKSCIVMDIPGEMISWKSLPDALVENSGKIEFRQTGVNSTELHLNISYKPPMGLLGGMVSDFFHGQLEETIKQDIDAFKIFAEESAAVPDPRDLAYHIPE